MADKVRYADMPLTSELNKKQMTKATMLLKEAHELKEEIARLNERLGEIMGDKDTEGELERIQTLNELPGLRWGDYVYVRSENKGRATLKKDLLIEAGVSAEIIKDCTVEGNPVVTRKLVNLASDKTWGE